MLGKTLSEMKLPRKLEVTTKLRDAILENWKEERTFFQPTLEPMKEVWREFWLHASVAHNWCPRMAALEALTPSREPETLEAELLWLFDQGHAYHDMFQQKILPCLADGVFQGSWQRTVIDPTDFSLRIQDKMRGLPDFPDRDIVRGWVPRPEGDGWRYVESKIRWPRERIVVKLDGILAWPDQPAEVLEIKTERLSARDSLNPAMGGVPREKHVVQANIGMAATGLTRARILYVFKGADNLSSSLLEFVIERDDEMIGKLLALAYDCRCAVAGAEEARWAALEKITDETDEKQFEEFKAACMASVPPRLPECPMKSKGRARFCPGREMCFPKGYLKAEKV